MNIIAVNLCKLRNNASSSIPHIFNGIDRLVCDNCVGCHEEVGIDSTCGAEGKIIHIFQIVRYKLVISGIDDGVHKVKIKVEWFFFLDVRSYNWFIDTGTIGEESGITFLYSKFIKFKLLGGKFACHLQYCFLLWTKPPVELQSIIYLSKWLIYSLPLTSLAWNQLYISFISTVSIVTSILHVNIKPSLPLI